MAQNHEMKLRPPATETTKQRPARDDADKKAIERAENEGLAETPGRPSAGPVRRNKDPRGGRPGQKPLRSENE
ncbi:MAG TPA: hypothetical protein VFY03_12805 [Woeseiaceae bacterium]|nr:hypothetical protein [Woeseiaceae bacterium]